MQQTAVLSFCLESELGFSSEGMDCAEGPSIRSQTLYQQSLVGLFAIIFG